MGGKGSGVYPREGRNRAAILNALEALKHPRVDVRDVQAIEDRINEYIAFCAEKDIAASVAGCASWLGVNPSTLEKWYTGERATPEHQRAAARFYGLLQDVWAQKMDNGDINPVSGIFMGKAFYGYKDTQEIVIQHNAAQNQLTAAELIEGSKQLADNLLTDGGTQNTIDADYTVIEDDPRYEKSLKRAQKTAERKAEVEANKPRRKAAKKEYLKTYYQEHKQEQLERNARSRAKAKAKKAAEQAQKEAKQASKTAQKAEN